MTRDELIKRVDVFDDTEEVVTGMASEAEDYQDIFNTYPYFTREGIEHILGLWELVNDMKKELEKNEESSSKVPKKVQQIH